MNRKLKRSEIIGCLFVWAVGTLLHFFYDWSNKNPIVGLFSPVNESLWEHLKLLFFPTVIYTAFQYFYVGKKYASFFTAKLLGIISGMLLIVVGFYITLAIAGKPVTWVDITLFFVGVLVAYIISYQFIIRQKMPESVEIISFLMLLTIIVLFWGFTYYPPNFSLFKEIKE